MVGSSADAESDHYPRKLFDEAVEYAVKVSRDHLEKLKYAGVSLDCLRYLEIGPGSDFAPQLVLASYGVRVTLADKYLAAWDPAYHPQFYESFLQRWTGPSDAVRAVLSAGNYDRVLRLVREPAEKLSSFAKGSFDFVLSNAVLEHVMDIHRCVAELARITVPGGIHAHQVDFRYHTRFDRPLDHLLIDSRSWLVQRRNLRGALGTTMRMPEMLEAFTPYFWVWAIEANDRANTAYVCEIREKLALSDPYKYWPVSMLGQTGGRLWLTRKDRSRPSRFRLPWRARLMPAS